MKKLAEFLGERLAERGTSASFARRLSVSQATVTRWVMGKSEPHFESCIRIADYFEIDPREVFQLADKPGFEELYNRTFPEYKRANLSSHDLYKHDEHSNLHTRIQRLWSAAGPIRSCIRIADYFEIDPREVFQLADKPGFEELYNRTFPEYKRANLSSHDLYKVSAGNIECDAGKGLLKAQE